jgi:hypothetical protein
MLKSVVQPAMLLSHRRRAASHAATTSIYAERGQAGQRLGGRHDVLLMALLMATVSSADSEWLDLLVARRRIAIRTCDTISNGLCGTPSASGETKELPTYPKVGLDIPEDLMQRISNESRRTEDSGPCTRY